MLQVQTFISRQVGLMWERAATSKRVSKQLIAELWMPLLVAAVWAWHRAFQSPGEWVTVFIANFSASFFFTSWALSQFHRVRRQQDVEDAFSGLKTTLENVVVKLNEALERPNNSPDLERSLRELLDATKAANTQVAVATTAMSHATGTGLGWYSEWQVPPRFRPNPAVYEPASNFVPPPPANEEKKAQ
jgi:hypothetical protein